MNTKSKLPLLLGIFGVLLAAVLIYSYMNAGKKASNYNPQLVELDTASVTRIAVTPKAGGEPYDLVSKDGIWFVSAGGKEFKADSAIIHGILGELASIRSQRVVAANRSGWDAFELSDSASTRVEAFDGSKQLCQIYIGKFSFQQSQNPYQRQPEIRSHIRVAGDERAYMVDGMLSMAFNRRASDMRNQTLLHISPETIDRVKITADGSMFSLMRDGSSWILDGTPVDSAITANYIAMLTNSRCSESSDESVDNKRMAASIEISTSRGTQTIRAFGADDARSVLLTTSTDDVAVFRSDSTGIYERLFRPASYFILPQ